jgi:hypothetical protein
MEELVAILNIKGFPDTLYEAIRQRARRERRSLSQEVIHLLRRVMEAEEPLSLLDLKGLGRDRWGAVDPAEHVERERSSWD